MCYLKERPLLTSDDDRRPQFMCKSGSRHIQISSLPGILARCNKTSGIIQNLFHAHMLKLILTLDCDIWLLSLPVKSRVDMYSSIPHTQ